MSRVVYRWFRWRCLRQLSATSRTRSWTEYGWSKRHASLSSAKNNWHSTTEDVTPTPRSHSRCRCTVLTARLDDHVASFCIATMYSPVSSVRRIISFSIKPHLNQCVSHSRYFTDASSSAFPQNFTVNHYYHFFTFPLEGQKSLASQILPPQTAVLPCVHLVNSKYQKTKWPKCASNALALRARNWTGKDERFTVCWTRVAR